MPAPSTGTIMSTESGLYRLLAWASPAFPTGGFSYSHALEAAAADGAIHDRATLESWIRAALVHGSGRVDADILRDAWSSAQSGDDAGLREANRRGCAYRATAELALESGQQGAAFVAAYEAAWANPYPPSPAGRVPPSPASGRGVNIQSPRPLAGEGGDGRSPAPGEGNCHAAVFGAAAARAGVPLPDAMTAYLQVFAANLMSAGLRLGIVGQSDGQRILAALEPAVAGAVAAAARAPEDFGAATFALDLASMAHETQYSRLFRS
jgi:urease accessory protein